MVLFSGIARLEYCTYMCKDDTVKQIWVLPVVGVLQTKTEFYGINTDTCAAQPGVLANGCWRL